MLENLEKHIDLSRSSSVGYQIDLWLTLLALFGCIETLGVCGLAIYRYSRRIYNARLQVWTMRIILIGPIYSCLMWFSLWTPKLDYYIALPVGIYEAYAFFCFYAMLVCFADGENCLIVALQGAFQGPPTAYIYHPFGNFAHCGQYTPLFAGRVHYSSCLRFQTSKELLRYLRRCIMQAMIIKPLNLIIMLLLSAHGYNNYANYSRILSIISLWLVANSLTQCYHVVLPRIRGLGGDKMFILFVLMLVVLIVQDIVVAALLINSGTSSATADFATRLIFIFTILEFTAFSTIFYRLLPPEKFAQINWSNSNSNLTSLISSTPTNTSMPIHKFIGFIIDPRTIFALPRVRERDLGSASFQSNNGSIQCITDEYGGAGVRESKKDDDDGTPNLVYDEYSPLIK
uniref:Uncharacterized protein n=1 Tax=Aureoumbra lagunensis TaxID=44058 RepID=A0A7S3NN12_9STRA